MLHPRAARPSVPGVIVRPQALVPLMLVALLQPQRPVAHALGLIADSDVPVVATKEVADPRIVEVLDTGWRFHLGDVVGAHEVGFNDRGWTGIRVPHTWNLEDGADGGGDYARDAGWYRYDVWIPDQAVGRKLFLDLGAANLVADVWLNGEHIGSHAGGYTAFRFELTSVAKPGVSNLLAIRVDNRHDPDMAPLAADYTFFGGLYRPVRLIATDHVHFRMLDAGSSGIFATPELALDDPSAGAMHVLVKLWNSQPDPTTVSVRARLEDADGHISASTASGVAVDADSGGEARLQMDVEQPRLWQGVDDPYLYSLVVELWAGQRLRDVRRLPIGFRRYELAPDGRLLLNGRTLRIRGVNRHQDRQGKGWALSAADHELDLLIIRDMGANAVRLAHYPQDPAVYEAADRLGLTVWSEIPVVNRISGSREFADNAKLQLREMIRQHYNHSSVAVWGIANEVTLDPEGPDPNELLSELAELAKSEDPTRLTGIASCCTDPMGDETSHTDLVGFNRYYGWYEGSTDDLGVWADDLIGRSPGFAFGLTEYGAGANVNHHQWPPRKPRHDGNWHPEEYQALVHEALWSAIDARPYMWGGFVWNMFDFASDARDEGAQPGINDKGLVNYERGARKDAFGFYQAAWSSEPSIWIAGRRFEARSAAPVDVKAYSSASRVTLDVDGAQVDEIQSPDVVKVFRKVRLQPGKNRLTVRVVGDDSLSSSVVWTRLPTSILVPAVGVSMGELR